MQRHLQLQVHEEPVVTPDQPIAMPIGTHGAKSQKNRRAFMRKSSTEVIEPSIVDALMDPMLSTPRTLANRALGSDGRMNFELGMVVYSD